jgi:predicted transcriptional regulator
MSWSQRYSEAVALYRRGLSCKKAAEAMGLTQSALYQHLKRLRITRTPSEAFAAAEVPDEATIRERAEAIRQSWSEEEVRRRWVGDVGARALAHRKFKAFRSALTSRRVA